MPSVIDSLVVSIGLDVSKYKLGAKEVDDLLKKLAEQNRKTGKQIEESGKTISNTITKIASVVGSLYALMLGGRGFKEFIADVNNANAAIGRFSANLGLAPQEVSEFTMLVERFGGTASDASSTLENMNNQIQDFLVYGKSLNPDLIQMLSRVGKGAGDITFDKGAIELLKSLQPVLKEMNRLDPALAHRFAQGMGISDSVANTLIGLKNALGSEMKGVSPLAATNQQIESAQKLLGVWAETEQIVAKIGSDIAGFINPALTTMLEKFNTFLSNYEAGLSKLHFIGWDHGIPQFRWGDKKESQGNSSPFGSIGNSFQTSSNDNVVEQLKSNMSSRIESGGNYGAVGPVTRSGDRAYGKYQVMGDNIPSWTRDILGRSMTTDEFLSNPDAQEKVASAKLWEYYHQTGSLSDAASMWFTGRALGKGGAGAKDINNMTGARYARIATAGITGAGGAASLSSIGTQYQATTDNTINNMHVGRIDVNMPPGSDANSIAAGLGPALAKYGATQYANTGWN